MATTEHNGLLVYKDASGNKKVLYPITKTDLIEGLEELLASHNDRKDNPHGVTAAQAGAAPVSHEHDATDIISGIIPVARGGTGVASLAELAAQLPGAMIESGTYTGTGVYGSGNANSLSFSFNPAIVVVRCMTGTNQDTEAMILCEGCAIAYRVLNNTSVKNHVTWGEKSVSWYLDGDVSSTFKYPQYQYNHSGRTYKYIAIG